MAKASQICTFIFLISLNFLGVFVHQSESKSLLQQEQQPQALFDGPHCFLTLHEIVGKDAATGALSGREIELNWRNFEDRKQEDWIGLFDYDPSVPNAGKDHAKEALDTFPVQSPNGREKSSVQFKVENFTLSVNQERCHKYFVGYFQSSQLTHAVSSNCFRLYPTWMNDLKDTIGDTPLNSLMIPGTHDAGAWLVYNGDNNDLVTRYTMTQEENIRNQFVAGIRYVDIRAAKYPNDPQDVFWVNHDIVKIRPMRTVLADVAEFVRATNEIIFLDFHLFPVGFDNNRAIHDEFLAFVKGFLGDYMAPKNLGAGVTLNQLKRAGKNVIVTYNDNYQNDQALLWPYLTHAWGDVNQLEALEKYISQAVQENGCKGKFWSTMAELTPAVQDWITHPNKGLRGMANDVNKPLNNWYTNGTLYSKSNIVSTDYFFGNNIIETCVTVNKNRGVEC